MESSDLRLDGSNDSRVETPHPRPGVHPSLSTRGKVRFDSGSDRLGAGKEDDTMARGRTFSRDFKLEVVRQVERGERRPAQICREHNLADGVLWRWRREYAERGEAAFAPPPAASAEGRERRIAELERFC